MNLINLRINITFYKKYGFFYDSLNILNDLEKELVAELSDKSDLKA